MATMGIQPQAVQQQQQHRPYPNQSVMEDTSDSGDDFEDDSMEGAIDMNQAQFYHQQQQQAIYYQQHQHGHSGASGPGQGHGYGSQDAGPSRNSGLITHGDMHDGLEEEEYSDDESSTASIPDENIDFSLTYALHTFLATVEGQASVVKGDSLLLLDDANSYWWLVRVLKTEDVGYIPAENIETPYERLARLNKHRNVDLAAATMQEKLAAERQDREKLKGKIAGKAKSIQMDKSGEGSSGDSIGTRRVIFAPPTYVDHPGKTWSSDEEDDSDGDEEEGAEDQSMEDDYGNEDDARQAQGRGTESVGPNTAQRSDMVDMEPDDGVEWADQATIEQQRRMSSNRQSQQPISNGDPTGQAGPTAGTNNPYLAARQAAAAAAAVDPNINGPVSPYDPAQAGGETKRITATPSVAQGAAGSPLLPSAVMQQQQQNGLTQRQASAQSQSANSLHSVVSNSSTQGSVTIGSPPEDKKSKKIKKSSKEDATEGGEKKKKGVLSGLFSRKSKDKGDKEKKGISSGEYRNSEDSLVSGQLEDSPASQGRYSLENSPRQSRPAATDEQQLQNPNYNPPVVSQHGLRLQQRDQALQQSYSNKYLKSSPSSDSSSPIAEQAAAAVAQSAAAMRLAAMNNGSSSNRPPSIMISPNPAGPPLLNVLRIFAGDHIKSEASFKTVLLNETTSGSDLIRQAMQRFHLRGASDPNSDSNFYLTIKDMSGEEMELDSHEKPLPAFQECVLRWAEDEEGQNVHTVKRSSISSISSLMSLSNHPAIAKLGMNDYGDDSAVKIYLNRRRPGSVQISNGFPEQSSEFSSYSTGLSTVQESSPEDKGQPHFDSPGRISDGTVTPPSQKYNPGLTINVPSQASPERFSSPSSKFTIQIALYQSDLPDGLVFDPTSDSVIPRHVLRDRLAAGHPNLSPRAEPKKRLFTLPRNATVVDAIEQGLERFGIQEGVVDGGDDVEDKLGNRKGGAKVRYTLSSQHGGEERPLGPSSKLLEAYSVPPKLRPVDRTTKEQRRRSRDITLTLGSIEEISNTDPIFVLRKVNPRTLGSRAIPQGVLQHQQQREQQQAPAQTNSEGDRGQLSPQEIIAAQRAASRATQKALISAQTNHSQGVDVVVRDKGVIRSSRQLEPNGSDVMRYSYIDDDGETYDISELLEEEWGQDSSGESQEILTPPSLTRHGTDQSVYVTAPSTPVDPNATNGPILGGSIPRTSSAASGSYDLLHSAIQRNHNGQSESKLEEKLHRVIEKVKSGSIKSSSSMDDLDQFRPVVTNTNTYTNGSGNGNGNGRPAPSSSASTTTGRTTPSQGPTGRMTPQTRSLSPLPEDREADLTPRPASKQANYQNTAASVNRIISRHRQQPSIASIASIMSAATPQEDEEASSTSMTATSSTHPTPPTSHNGTVTSAGIYTRAVSTTPLPTPVRPIKYTDDFGIKTLVALVQARARELGGPKSTQLKESDEVERYLVGDKVLMETVHPEIRGCFTGVQDRLDKFDEDVDELLARVGRRRRRSKNAASGLEEI